MTLKCQLLNKRFKIVLNLFLDRYIQVCLCYLSSWLLVVLCGIRTCVYRVSLEAVCAVFAAVETAGMFQCRRIMIRCTNCA